MPVPRTALCFCLALGAAAQDPGYYRFPATRGDRVYFTAEGDLWSAPVAGGRAQRLTTHPAEESRAAISPDGAWIAFSASYEGPQEVYVMPVAGGLPRRLSFEGFRAQVVGWTPSGHVLYAAQTATGPGGQRGILQVDPRTLARTALPVVDAVDACTDPSGKTLYFTRMGFGVLNDNARNYQGGAAGEVWRYDLAGGREAEKLPFPAPARQPMCAGDRLYVLLDRDGAHNLWSCRPDGSDLRQLTRHRELEVRNPSLGEGRIVYQLGADLRAFDLAKGEDRPLKLELVSDFDQQRERLIRRPLDFLDNTAFAPSGERVVLTARGRVAVAGLNALRRVDVALPAGSRAREATLSLDGKWVYAICDAGGELQLWRLPADGSPGGQSLTKEEGVPRASLLPSPDGRLIAHTDRLGRVYVLNPATGDNKLVDQASVAEVPDLVWSPDAKVLAIQRPGRDPRIRQIFLHALETGQTVALTSAKYESWAPAFTPDGRWLYFLSNRTFQAVNGSPWGDRNMGPHFDRRTRVYAVALQEGSRFPFRPRTELDGEAPRPEAKSEPKAEGKPGDKPADKGLPPIQWAGLAERLFEVPLAAGNYGSLRTDGKRLFLTDRDEGRSLLKTFEIGNAGTPVETFASDVRAFELSNDGKKLLFTRRSAGGWEFYLVDAGPKAPGDLSKAAVRVGDWSFTVDPRAEWRQMFADAWLMHRDKFFDPKMRGLDWKALRRKYEPLVARVTDRAELNDVLGQMTGELGALHSAVRPGELRQAPEAPAPAFLGAVLERTPQGYRVEHIYRTEAELPSEAGPLAQQGVRDGDLITHVNGRPVLEARDISDLLAGKAGQQVLLGLRRGKEELKPVVVTPVGADRQANLRYGDWEEACRRKVEEAGQGRLGYLHLRAMGGNDINTFAREFYANVDRGGLIIDVRRNGGGSIDSWIIEKLLRRTWAFWTDHRGNFADTNMQQTFRGHLVVLMDELTYSDGETFAAGIKALGLGPLVGRRTAGAGVWLSDNNTLVDMGLARAAEMPQYRVKDGAWMFEGHGVEPDVEVVNLPVETFKGRDRQLETAIRLLLDKLAKEPVKPLQPQGVPSLASGKKAVG